MVAGNVGTALTSLPGTLDARRGRRLRGVVVPARGHAGVRARRRRAAQPAEDHLDRHGTFENYRAAKLAVFAHQPPGTLAVVPAGLALEDAGGAATRVTFGESARAATAARGRAAPRAPTPTSPTATARCAGAASR